MSTPMRAERERVPQPLKDRRLVKRLLPTYLRLVSPEAFEERSPSDHTRALGSHLELAGVRAPGTARVRVSTPTVAESGWSAGGRSVAEIVIDDMPHLVDSVSAELARCHHHIHVVVHPVFDVSRDADGVLRSAAPVADARVPAEPGLIRESWMHVEIDRVCSELVAHTEAGLRRVLDDVRAVVDDRRQLDAALVRAAGRLRGRASGPSDDAVEAAALLDWLSDHFLCLGRREFARMDGAGAVRSGQEVLRSVPDTGLGVLGDHELSPADLSSGHRVASGDAPVSVTKAGTRASVVADSHIDQVWVPVTDDDGATVGSELFVGLLTRRATREAVATIPVVRRKVAEVMRRSGFEPRGHAGTSLAEILETLPRDELFHARADELAATAAVVMDARDRRSIRIALRRDELGRHVSALVLLPRDRYDASVRGRLSDLLRAEFDATDLAFDVRMESGMAHLHFLLWVPPGRLEDRVDEADLETRVVAAARSWRDDLVAAVIRRHGEVGTTRLSRYLDSFPRAYQEAFTAEVAAADLGVLVRLGLGDVDFGLYLPAGASSEDVRLKVFCVGEPVSLSRVLPLLSSLGFEVTDERPYYLRGITLESDTIVYDFGLHWPAGARIWRDPITSQQRLCDALQELWSDRGEVDELNVLILAAGLTHHQVRMLRAYACYLRQISSPLGLSTIATALRRNVRMTRLLVDLFETRFDPGAGDGREEQQDALIEGIDVGLDDVGSIDDDRVLRTFLALIRATMRTNHWQRSAGEPKEYLALKLDPSMVPHLPEPRPAHEIFVYSPRIEGVHLRFGPVARGGLRWSDRRDDFRTEVLGLAKAQQVKNAIITPAGAKGGFVAKRLPPAGAGHREAWLAEGKRAYAGFLRGLLDLTDNLVEGRVVPPPDVVRHDTDDSYLVVAADKGTASFSDLANEVAAEYDFWLGDAFASGGSVGYDHKALGITARGAWLSVRRHFREMGIDCQREAVTCVGIGDMSGDVFGNGMLLSEHLRLVAAFDHRDIFIDPDPDPLAAHRERRRLARAPRSSWQDYDRSALSAGGGVWSRRSKSVAVTPQVRAALGLADQVTALAPNDLIKAILRAPADLLWNGGVGTYVKAAHESHGAADDKVNNAVRVDADELRVKVVGEGGNLGFTGAARVEYAARGGWINTDAVDNSGGVDCSDREVNIKILLDNEVASDRLPRAERDALLEEMASEVAELVLQDNREQNLALGDAIAHAIPVSVHEEWIAELERRGVLSRAVEGLPSEEETNRRAGLGEGLTSPEHAILMSWTKIELCRALLDSDLPEDPYVARRLSTYFPAPLRERFAEAIAAHPLRREILATQVAGDVVNRAGKTIWWRLGAETDASTSDLVRAFLVAQEVFGAEDLVAEVAELDYAVDAGTQARVRIEIRTGIERASRWLLKRHATGSGASGFGEELVSEFRGDVWWLLDHAPGLLVGSEAERYAARRDRLVGAGVPSTLAGRVALLPSAVGLLGVSELARRCGRDLSEVLVTYLAVGERLGLPGVLQRINALPRRDRWATLARSAIRDELLDGHARLTLRALEDTGWLSSPAVEEVAAALAEMSGGEADVARTSVAARWVRGLAES